MKLAVVTIATGENYTKLGEITHPTLKNYANKLEADFIVWRDYLPHTLPAYQKMEIGALLEQYDRVLYVDTDIIIREDAPDIFKLVPETHLGIFEEGAFMDRRSAMWNLVKDKDWIDKGAYYNTGVIVVSKCHRDVFQTPTIEIDNFMDQTYINYMIYKSGHSVFHLPYKFNRMLWLDKIGEPRLDSYFLHYAGLLSNDVPIYDLAKEDIEQWRKDAETGFKYPRNIHFTVRGGFGDQVASEPALRFAKKTIFKNDNVLVHTDYPELFTHIDVKCHKFGDIIEDSGFYRIDLTPKLNPVANFSLMHQTDYASIMTFGGTIPENEKKVKLPNYRELMSHINHDHVLIHASKWWPTKTFPIEFWEMVAETVKDAGKIPVFIGKTSVDGPSVHEIDTSASFMTFNLVNQLSIKELIGAIQNCHSLITTDSAPLHIAGASKCNVGLVAPIRAPWTILPHRDDCHVLCNGEPWMIPDWSPNQVDEVRLDDAKYVKDLLNCLPTREQIRQFLQQ